MAHDDAAERDQLIRLIQAELDGEISPEDEAHLQQVLTERPDLATVYAEEKQLARLFAEDRAEFSVAPEGLADRINANLSREPLASPRAKVFSLNQWLRPAAAAAAIMVMVVAAFWAGRTTTSAEVPTFKTEVVEKFRETVSRENLDSTEADKLLEQFSVEIENLESNHKDELARIAREFENGLQRLVESNRRK